MTERIEIERTACPECNGVIVGETDSGEFECESCGWVGSDPSTRSVTTTDGGYWDSLAAKLRAMDFDDPRE